MVIILGSFSDSNKLKCIYASTALYITTERVTKHYLPLLFTGFILSTEVGSSRGEGGAWGVGPAGVAEDTQLKPHDACDKNISTVLALATCSALPNMEKNGVLSYQMANTNNWLNSW